MSDPPEAREAAGLQGFARAQDAGLCVVGVVGGLEFALVLAQTLRSAGESAPGMGLWAAALCETLLTHAILWIPVTWILYAALRPLAPGRAVPFAGGLALALALAGTVLAWLHWSAGWSAGAVAGALVAAGVAGLLVAVGVSWLAGLSPGAAQRLLRVPALVVGATLLVTAPFFYGSALSNPGADRPFALETSGTRPTRPHVLWIVLDTARADRMSVHGHEVETTPFLDAFAARATVFDAAQADGTWTSPSHASMFTGLPVRAHGVGRTVLGLDPRFETVASRLARGGYVTGSFSNNPLVDRNTGIAAGFETVQVPYHLRRLGRTSIEIAVERLGWKPPLPWLDRDLGAALTQDLVADWLGEVLPGGRPVFLFVNYIEAHLPWTIPERARRALLDPAVSARSRELRWGPYGDLDQALNERVAYEGAGFVTPADREILLQQYDATIRYLDDRVAELLQGFERAGLLDDTVVVITSDHGEYLGTHDLWSHLYRSYTDLTHVTMIVRDPGVAEGERRLEPVQLSDLAPTVLRRTLGVRPKPGAGRDLLARRSGPPPVVFSEAGRMGAFGQGAGGQFRVADTPRGRELARSEVAVRDDRFTLVVPERGAPELYDRHADPGEAHDVRGRHPEVVQRLRGELRRFERRVRPYEPAEAQELDPDSALGQALKALGYLSD